MGGGLGGGSSNAATVLVALNHLWGLGFDVDCLAELGLRLGADVPVFVRGQNAWAEGIGEQLAARVVDGEGVEHRVAAGDDQLDRILVRLDMVEALGRAGEAQGKSGDGP